MGHQPGQHQPQGLALGRVRVQAQALGVGPQGEKPQDHPQGQQRFGPAATEKGQQPGQAQNEDGAVEQQTPPRAKQLAGDALPPDGAEGFIGQIAGVERVAIAGQVVISKVVIRFDLNCLLKHLISIRVVFLGLINLT